MFLFRLHLEKILATPPQPQNRANSAMAPSASMAEATQEAVAEWNSTRCTPLEVSSMLVLLSYTCAPGESMIEGSSGLLQRGPMIRKRAADRSPGSDLAWNFLSLSCFLNSTLNLMYLNRLKTFGQLCDVSGFFLAK